MVECCAALVFSMSGLPIATNRKVSGIHDSLKVKKRVNDLGAFATAGNMQWHLALFVPFVGIDVFAEVFKNRGRVSNLARLKQRLIEQSRRWGCGERTSTCAYPFSTALSTSHTDLMGPVLAQEMNHVVVIPLDGQPQRGLALINPAVPDRGRVGGVVEWSA